jgi:hypothetical protein
MKFKTFKDLFVQLTSITVPHGSEYLYYTGVLSKLINFPLFQQGENYYHVVGDGSSDTLFCAHLDTACSISKPVRHGFFNSTIYTRSDTLLGADDKAGVLALIALIEAKVPGTYYFFAGEEVGRKGSLAAAHSHREYFSKFKRAVTFDRRGKGSIITSQLFGECCSDMFADALIREFKSNQLKFVNDPTGSYTDTASFMKIIPECTNISIGYDHEHTDRETINIDYAYKVAMAATQIDWDDLPYDRDPTVSYQDTWHWDSRYSHGNRNSYSSMGFNPEPRRMGPEPPVPPRRNQVTPPPLLNSSDDESRARREEVQQKLHNFLTAEEALKAKQIQQQHENDSNLFRSDIEVDFDELLNPPGLVAPPFVCD